MKRSRFVLALSVRQIAGAAALSMALAALVLLTLIDPSQAADPVQAKVATSPGERTYMKWCAECHASAIGPGTKALEQRYKGQVPAILHMRTGIPAELVTYTVRHGVGFMPPFRKTEISDSQLAGLASYLSSVDGRGVPR
jgi:mono/diheme cytochrome c family protein